MYVYLLASYVPFIVAGEQSETSVEPMKSYTDLLRKEELDDNLMAFSILFEFPWADTEENGVIALVVSKDSQSSTARKQWIWLIFFGVEELDLGSIM